MVGISKGSCKVTLKSMDLGIRQIYVENPRVALTNYLGSEQVGTSLRQFFLQQMGIIIRTSQDCRSDYGFI